MALSAAEEALVRQILAQQAAILSLAGNEATITSKLGATKVTLADLVSASSINDTDLLLARQGTTEKSLTPALLNTYLANHFVDLTTAQTVGGIKTFSNLPVLPGNAVAALQAIPKQQMDAALVALATSGTSIDQSALFSGAQLNLVLPDILVKVNGSTISIPAQTLLLSTAGNWDSATYATAANRAGKDFYVYAKEAGGVILSLNASYPTGYTALNTRKIGGFHCLAVAVGAISGHTLTGYVVGDILPRTVWDRFNRSSARQEGTFLSSAGVWIDIYLPSVSGSNLVSVNGGTIADGVSAPAFHCYKFEQWFARQGMKSISQLEFFAATQGANQGTNIVGSVDPTTTTGHSDTAGRRMISNEGMEDGCGVLWQWSRDQGGISSVAAWANAYDANDAGVGGQHYNAPYRGALGGYWAYGVICGSRGSGWSSDPLALPSNYSGRGVAEPANNRF
jgi:hypothetical protein